MKNNLIKYLQTSMLWLTACAVFVGCAKDEETPRIDSVWMNMVSRPVEPVTCAYPGQTICLRGSGLGDLKRVIVGGTDINLNTLFVYESSSAITFQIPSDISTTGDNIRVVTRWGMADYPFVIRPKTEEPTITAFSATTLVAGRTLTITGTHLDGAIEVWLPQTFDGRIRCELDGEQPSDGTSLRVVIPEGATFAAGRCEVVMQKHDAERSQDYTVKAYSVKTNFSN